jgi:hypothetical protein
MKGTVSNERENDTVPSKKLSDDNRTAALILLRVLGDKLAP